MTVRRRRGAVAALAPRRGRVAADVADALDGADVGVDCLLGTGATGEPRPPYREAVEALDARPELSVVACDAPTGVDAHSGHVPGLAVAADVTVTLGAHKAGLQLWPAPRALRPPGAGPAGHRNRRPARRRGPGQPWDSG